MMTSDNIANVILLCAVIVIFFFLLIYILFSKSNRAKMAKKNYKNSKILNCVYNENSSIEASSLYDFLEEKNVILNYLGYVSYNNIGNMSKRTHFDNFWYTAVCPAIEKCQKDMNNLFVEKCTLQIRDMNEYKMKLEFMYKRKREWLKREYLPHLNNPLLDFHKLASVICRCIVGTKPISYDVETAEILLEDINSSKSLTHNEKLDWIVSNIYVNYKIAFLAAIGIVYSDLIYWAYEKSYSEELKKNANSKIYMDFAHALENEGNLIFYPNPLRHENFYNSIIIALAKGDLLQRDFDYLFLSAIFYQIQEYTKQNLFNNILKKYNMDISDIELT